MSLVLLLSLFHMFKGNVLAHVYLDKNIIKLNFF